MRILERFTRWLDTPPSKDDLFFVNIRESYQAIKKIDNLSKIICGIIYVTSLLILAVDIFFYKYISFMGLLLFCASLMLFAFRFMFYGKEDPTNFTFL